MTSPKSTEAEQIACRAAAAGWMARRERGLSAAESIEYELWLAANAEHGAAMRTVTEAWTLLERTPESFVHQQLAAAVRRRTWRRRVMAFSSLAAAAALVVTASWRLKPSDGIQAENPGLIAAGPRELALVDGSFVQLNAGSEVVEEFDQTERRVRLTRGEAHFTVMKDPNRPFVVVAGTLRVRAVGTAFNVNRQSSRIEVLVTEGSVQLATAKEYAADPVEAGQLAVMIADDATPEIAVTRPDPAAITRALAWQDSLVRLGGATLAEVGQDFERRFGVRLIFEQPELAHLRAGGRLRADNPQSFAHLLATTFDLEVEHASDGAWVLRKKNSKSR